MRRFCAIILIVAFGMAWCCVFEQDTAQAQTDYPSRPIRLVIGYSPGSAADLMARVLGHKLGQILGQPIIVESRPGAASSIAAEFVARAPKDGYTLFLPGTGNVANAVMNPNLSFDIGKDFEQIARISSVAVILVVHSSVPANSVAELIALAKSRPGELSYASTGIGSTPHLSGELLMQHAGVHLVHVPYSGSSQAAVDLLAGRVQMMFAPASAVIGLAREGKLKMLASAGQRRAGILPDLPTMIESGMPDFDTAIWAGISAPAGTPRSIIERLSNAVREALAGPEVTAAWLPQGIDAVYGNSDDLARLISSELRRWAGVVQAAGVRK